MKKYELVNIFVSAIQEEYNYIAVYVQVKYSSKPEIIINSTSNFKEKLEYYVNAYDDDLKLKTCNDIYILNVKKINSFSELDKKNQ